MNLNKINTIYFLGIGGIGMSALARFFQSKKKNVFGYDKTPSQLTDELMAEGMNIHFEENIQLVPENVDIVVYTPAIPANNKEYQWFIENKIPMMKRSEILGILSDSFKTIAIAGTHGKTTTSTLTAHLLKQSSLDCTAFLGGIAKNYQTNLLLSDKSNLLVAEADEFDRSFLHLHPHSAVITSADADHLDIYKDKNQLQLAFVQFASQVKPKGNLIIKKGVNLNLNPDNQSTLYSYSLESGADFFPENIQIQNGLYTFDFVTPDNVMKNMKLGLPGLFNVENAIAALAVAYLNGVNEQELRTGLGSFLGVKRRFDFRINNPGLVYIDDYAHHPAELRACITSARHLFPGKRISGIFQPHLYSRTRDFADEFALSLDLLDEIILLPIYPARELPIKGIDSEMLLQKIKNPNKTLLVKDQLVDELIKNEKLEVLLTLGAGDIDRLVPIIEEALKNR
ncbi:MAG TPA: UDP-N-acetylmuramate--L-alanine ligase [Bacteroidales bacterium]|nr:UDP-N-acetylmuramate--L-alanine ligase [Bacteroidales bacterium]